MDTKHLEALRDTLSNIIGHPTLFPHTYFPPFLLSSFLLYPLWKPMGQSSNRGQNSNLRCLIIGLSARLTFKVNLPLSSSFLLHTPYSILHATYYFLLTTYFSLLTPSLVFSVPFSKNTTPIFTANLQYEYAKQPNCGENVKNLFLDSVRYVCGNVRPHTNQTRQHNTPLCECEINPNQSAIMICSTIQPVI